jgi:hypothetical protein
VKRDRRKKVKRFILKLILLSVLLTAAVILLNVLAEHAGDVYKDGAAFVCETKREMVRSGEIHPKKGKVNVLFMGTSHILAGIVPDEFDRLSSGRTYSYNLALPALGIGSSYFILKDWLEHGSPPQYVVMELYIKQSRHDKAYNYYANQGISGISEAFAMAGGQPDKSILLDYFFPFRMYKYQIPVYVFDSMFRPSRIRRAKKNNRAILKQMTAARGYYYIAEQAAAPKQQIPETVPGEQESPVKSQSQYDPYQDPLLEKFFRFTAEHDIKVLLIQPPTFAGRLLQNETMPHQYRAILDRFAHVKMAKEGWKLNFYDRKLFADQFHLSKKGALLYTRNIYKEFQEVMFSKK